MAEMLTVAEAAKSLGLSPKAVSRRVERGTLQSVRRDGRRLIPRGEIERAQAEQNGQTAPDVSPVSQLPREDLSAMLARLEALAAENVRLRALTEIADSTEQRLTHELHQVRAELAAERARRWWQRRPNRALLDERQETVSPHRNVV